ncbi:glycosyltransferase family 4 protein [Salinirubrum litoreum]|uniref:Glycosyltransferase family 4 protein n=1 Tax=Salinirubrum litoreum TaxID=1126234 RepID=A0ABD5RF67_9EURY|nr:glycosyltransferase family 4 protein [Salinirubrum litoreum]
MRVLMIAPAPFEYDRGKSIRIRQTVTHLADLGYEIDVLTYPVGDDPEREGVSLTRAPELFAQVAPSVPGVTLRQLGSNAALLVHAIRKLRRHRYDVIHAHDVDGALIGQVARLLTRRDVPLVYDMHGTFEELNEQYDVVDTPGVADRLQSYLHDAVDHLVVNWPHIEDLLKTDTPRTLILDEPDPAVCDRLERLRSGEVTPTSNPWGDTQYVLYTGNYAEYQGVDLLLAAFDRLDTDGERKLVLTGDDTEAPQTTNRDVVYTGFVDEERLADLLFGADVLVSPRQTDGFPPMKVLYYLRTDAPMVVTDRTCHTSVLDGLDGVTFADETPAAFAEAIREALADRTRYSRSVSRSTGTDAYRRIYEQLVTATTNSTQPPTTHRS